jgi:hypothetical protein
VESQNPQTGRINKPNVPGRTNKKQAVELRKHFYALECRPIDFSKGSVQAEQNPNKTKVENKNKT